MVSVLAVEEDRRVVEHPFERHFCLALRLPLNRQREVLAVPRRVPAANATDEFGR